MAEKCTGTVHTTGKRCRKWPIKGATVCPSHGGAAPQVRAKAAERVAEQKFDNTMQRELARLDVRPVDDPLTALSLLAGQAVAFKDALAERVNELKSVRYEDMKGSEQLRSEVALWERALDRCERFCTSMARLGIDERLVRIEEAQAELVVGAIEAALDAAGVPADKRPLATAAAIRHLRVVA